MTQEPEKLTALTDFDDGPEAMLRRPELAAMIAAVASRATWIEDAFARLFVYLLNREEEAALSIYLNFFDNGVRLRVFNAVADTRLSEDDRKKFKKLHEQLATKLKPRNNLVHAWWVTSDKHPDALLLVDERNSILVTSNIFTLILKMKTNGLPTYLASPRTVRFGNILRRISV